MSIYFETAAKHKHEAIKAGDAGQLNEACTCWLLAAEMYDKAGDDVAAAECRSVSGVYGRLRDAERERDEVEFDIYMNTVLFELGDE